MSVDPSRVEPLVGERGLVERAGLGVRGDGTRAAGAGASIGAPRLPR
ncbi:hypothetical protein ACFV0T_14965 [Streptomyces sp. NPDC059582]